MRELVALLAHEDVLVEELRTDRPGYIVHEDAHRLVAIRFADTRRPHEPPLTPDDAPVEMPGQVTTTHAVC